jgi:hypothetical protein
MRTHAMRSKEIKNKQQAKNKRDAKKKSKIDAKKKKRLALPFLHKPRLPNPNPNPSSSLFS